MNFTQQPNPNILMQSFTMNQKDGLGAEYLSEFQTTINFIVKEPLSYPQSRNPGIRKANLHRFPFGIIYRMVDNKIQILAISHFRRKPEYWTKRV